MISRRIRLKNKYPHITHICYAVDSPLLVPGTVEKYRLTGTGSTTTGRLAKNMKNSGTGSWNVGLRFKVLKSNANRYERVSKFGVLQTDADAVELLRK